MEQPTIIEPDKGKERKAQQQKNERENGPSIIVREEEEEGQLRQLPFVVDLEVGHLQVPRSRDERPLSMQVREQEEVTYTISWLRNMLETTKNQRATTNNEPRSCLAAFNEKTPYPYSGGIKPTGILPHTFPFRKRKKKNINSSVCSTTTKLICCVLFSFLFFKGEAARYFKMPERNNRDNKIIATRITTVIACYNEEENELQRTLMDLHRQKHCPNHQILLVFDGIEKMSKSIKNYIIRLFPESGLEEMLNVHSDRLIKIIKEPLPSDSSK